MKGFRRLMQKATIVLWIASGSVLLGSSCASDIRDTLVSAGLDFIDASAITVLETFVPVEDILTGGAG